MTPALLDVRGLTVHGPDGPLVADVSFTVAAGERVGVIGESGSGKSLTAAALLALLPDELPATGAVLLGGRDLLTMAERDRCRVRGAQVGMVFQEPMSALDPTMRVGRQVATPLRVHRRRPGGLGPTAAAADLLAQVGLPGAARRYPHQLSGGQRQRVGLAIAVAGRPDLVVCDEPTTALDVTTAARVLELIEARAAERDTALLFVSHDLAVIARLCRRVLVLHGGRLVESGPTVDVLGSPQHPHTQALLAAALDDRPRRRSVGAADATVAAPDPPPALEVHDLHRTYRGGVTALRGVSFTVAAGERFGIVGESGSGKSTLVRLLAALDRPTSGRVHVAGDRVDDVPARRLRSLRGRLQVVFQDPSGSLDPRMTVRDIVTEPLVALGVPAAQRARRAAELLTEVGLPPAAADRYPHAFSGGQRQRIGIARALAPHPRVLLADEPVSALDATVRGQVLDLLDDLVDRLGLALVLVSHDLGVVRGRCDRVAVLRRGEIVEHGPTDQVWAAPEHPYTRELLAAAPDLRALLPPSPSPSPSRTKFW